MKDTIISVGIDVGTSTTQIIFSRLKIKNTGGFGSVPKFEIVSKEILYRSDIYFTPLSSEAEIDGERAAEIIAAEYKKCGISPDDIDTGAVIITGESSRKRNASSVVDALSEAAGDFVVAQAGPALESVLAGKGSGAAALSEESGMVCANFDIGGGTTNIAVFKDGAAVDTSCLDIGGRLVKTDGSNNITYIAPKLQKLLAARGISAAVGQPLDDAAAYKISAAMTDILEQAAGLSERTPDLDIMVTDKPLDGSIPIDIFTFSGGVADCIYAPQNDMHLYNDIGCYLGRAISQSAFFTRADTRRAAETIRATVIGAGNFSMDVSGSTIEYCGCTLPLKGIPAAYVELSESGDIPLLRERVSAALSRFDGAAAICAKGLKCPSFREIESIADSIYSAAAENIADGEPLVVILQSDIAKALGQALKRRIKGGFGMVCIDGISCSDGDFVDIGAPAADGSVLPVIVKTLIFGG